MRPFSSPRAAAPLLLLAAAACSSAPSTPQVPIAAGKPAAAPAPINDLASVVAVQRPAAFVLDGDLREWGSLVPPPSPASAPPAASARERPAQAPPPDPSSRVAIALDSKGATIAAEVATEPAEGIWVGISFGEPDLPMIGSLLRWGGMEELNCESGPDGEPLPPDRATWCKGLVDAHAAFGAAHVARFRRFYKLDAQGVRLVGDGGALVPVDGSQLVFKPFEKGFRVEATLPAKALPRTQQAPLQDFGAVARVKPGGKPPEVAPESWAFVGPPEPVGFEPSAALRAAVFAVSMGRFRMGPFSMSYQPGDDWELEDLGYVGAGTLAVEAKQHILYSRQATLGDVEVGYAYAGGESLAVLKNGEVLGIVDILGEARAVERRGDEIHVISFERYTPSDDSIAERAQWHVIAVEADGDVREDVVDRTDVPVRWADASTREDHSADHSTLTIAGSSPVNGYAGETPESAVRYLVTWTWDAEAKVYVPKVEDGSKPAPKKGAPGKKGPAKAAPAKAAPGK